MFECARRSWTTRASRTNVASLLRARHADADDHVTVNGWVRSVRKQKNIAFAAIGDASRLEPVQAVLKPDHAAQLSTGAAVTLSGVWKASRGAKQSHELQAERVQVRGENDAEHNPIQPKYQTADYLRTVPHLRPRIPANTLLLRLRSEVICSVTSFFHRQGFVQCHTPIITSSDCEGAGEVFTLSSNASGHSDHKLKPHADAPVHHFFRSPKYLTVSAQLHLEALAQAVDKVWTLSPTFRAEKSDTPRHLSEFYMLEAEHCFTQSLDDVMSVVEEMLIAVATHLNRSKLAEELLKCRHDHLKRGDTGGDEKLITADILTERWAGLSTPDWPRITYTEALSLLHDATTKNPSLFTSRPTFESGLQAEHERYLANTLGGRVRNPVFVTDYPADQKPFYMAPSTSTGTCAPPDTVACFDLLVPDLCELAGGSIREHRSSELARAMQAKNVAGQNLSWYQDLRKYGSVPHGGFGLGFDRLICYLSGVANVRDVVAFPRWYSRAEC